MGACERVHGCTLHVYGCKQTLVSSSPSPLYLGLPMLRVRGARHHLMHDLGLDPTPAATTNINTKATTSVRPGLVRLRMGLGHRLGLG